MTIFCKLSNTHFLSTHFLLKWQIKILLAYDVLQHCFHFQHQSHFLHRFSSVCFKNFNSRKRKEWEKNWKLLCQFELVSMFRDIKINQKICFYAVLLLIDSKRMIIDEKMHKHKNVMWPVKMKRADANERIL